ncbi:MAG: hypothetical protein M1837_006003 [Sclerophora amabilis]|nr:MAG: hypothetical protein M1837_006003 [Sclerophora amabilis]
MDQHKAAVDIIAANVRGFYERKEKFRIYHGSTNSTRRSSYQRDKIIDTSQLVNVLKIDPEMRTVLVEPNLSMERLVESTTEHGLLPPVVMEFPGITVGGGFAGTAGESSSFKYGIFDCTVNQIEVVLANGEVVKASATERSDLFSGAAGSCGTLGVVTMLEIQLIKAKRFVELTYHPVASVSETIQKIKEGTEDSSVDYVDGIIFSPNSAVIMAGRLTDTCQPGTRIQRYSRAYDPWFYQRAERLVAGRTGPITEAIPIVDYLFRYDRGGFWGGAIAFRYFITPFNRVTRWALDYFMHASVMYHALHESGLAEQTIAQDLSLPFSTVQHFIEYIHKVFKIYPLWLCPVRPSRQGMERAHRSFFMGKDAQPNELLLNVGVWGMGPRNHDQFVDLNRDLERKVHELSGLKCLYAHTYYTEEEFWEIYDREDYETLRQKYHATSLPTVYDKVKTYVPNKYRQDTSISDRLLGTLWSIWPLSGLYGVFRVLIGGDYLLRKGDKESKKRR